MTKGGGMHVCMLQVKGRTTTDSYVVFSDHYCSCKAFKFDIVGKAEGILVSSGWPHTTKHAVPPFAASLLLVLGPANICYRRSEVYF